MRKRLIVAATGVAALVAAGGIAVAGGSSGASGEGAPGSRLDDGKQYLPQARITEQQAIDTATRTGSGDLNEVDLEHRDGQLVWNVDVGDRDVQVDATDGTVVGSSRDD
jgi:uncharacterized membrane protein YkoI